MELERPISVQPLCLGRNVWIELKMEHLQSFNSRWSCSNMARMQPLLVFLERSMVRLSGSISAIKTPNMISQAIRLKRSCKLLLLISREKELAMQALLL